MLPNGVSRTFGEDRHARFVALNTPNTLEAGVLEFRPTGCVRRSREAADLVGRVLGSGVVGSSASGLPFSAVSKLEPVPVSDSVQCGCSNRTKLRCAESQRGFERMLASLPELVGSALRVSLNCTTVQGLCEGRAYE